MLWEHLETYTNVIWDWNGTLLDDQLAAWRAEAKMFAQLGLPHASANERRRIFTMPVEEYYRRLKLDFTKLSYHEISHAWFANYQDELKSVTLFEGTPELLKRVVHCGKKQFILTAAPQKHVETHTKKLGIREYFHAIYGLEGVTADSKLSRGRALFHEHALAARETLIIGDMVHDAEVADELGCAVLLIADGHQDYEALLATGKKVLKSRF